MVASPFDLSLVESAFPDFEGLSHLDSGSFKSAYVGTRGGGEIVLKILHEPLGHTQEDEPGDTLMRRFARELDGMFAVKSPHVVSPLAPPETCLIGSSRHLWYAEPFYSGGTLEYRLENGEHGWPLAQAVTVACLRAVEALWESAGIVHRDIKPGNIVFDSAGNAILLDLGIAYFSELTDLTDGALTSPKTPRYAAPEQFEMRRDAQIDFRTDLFLAGMVGFEALTGRHPFWYPGIDSGTFFTRMNSFSSQEVVGLECPEEFKTVLLRLLSNRPARRYRKPSIALAAMEAIS